MISNVPSVRGNTNDIPTLQKYLVQLKQDLEYSFMHIDSTNIVVGDGKEEKDTNLNTYMASLLALLDSEIARMQAYIDNALGDIDFSEMQAQIDAINEFLENMPANDANIVVLDHLPTTQAELDALGIVTGSIIFMPY